MSIGNRVLLGFASIILLTGILGFYSLQQMDAVRTTTETILSRDIAALRQIQTARDNQYHMREARAAVVIRSLTGGNEAAVTPLIATWRSVATQTEASLNELLAAMQRREAVALSPDRMVAWRDVAQSVNQAVAVVRQIISQSNLQFQAVRTGDATGIVSAGEPLTALNEEFERAMQQMDQALDRAIRIGQERINSFYNGSQLSVLILLGGALLLAIVAVVLTRRSITRPIGVFMDFLEGIGRGDLTGTAPSSGRDEFARLGATLNSTVEGLRQLAKQSHAATENLNAAAAEIRASTQQQAASVEEQLAAVQETAATVDEITHAGAQVGKRAQEVIASAQATAQTSAAGVRAVGDTSRAMDAIREQAEAVAGNIVALSEKTQAIGDIISTVNDISERSHLLALNAALEAAAAGEHGRSFAVVAAEMKTLADQAKDATGQVRSILGDIQRGINSSVMLTEEAVKRVAAGKERTDTTLATINEITSRVQEGVHTFQQIIASTNQQQLGIEQVMTALQNIRQASQQTAVSTRQLDSAAGNLAGLAQQLVTFADRYRL
ncbi:methyl-accepting chemotaxis protein [Belnapia sp. T6]|uniref:Methyl-accepting chemotaxis protein n=1 Tax=Belnapia mucosa TaxID=2804532 RepID=A0ABS1V1Y8_9PROT|nr:methyl-accepting chemotaxis protein [Belnapia mucosa]MBL6455718.1 methyl-accepting chemotaxis protein [Belnapia mucosa]